MTLYRVEVRRTTHEKTFVYIAAPSEELAAGRAKATAQDRNLPIHWECEDLTHCVTDITDILEDDPHDR